MTMQTLHTTARADAQGVLHLELPVGSSGVEFDLVVVLQPKASATRDRGPEDLGWPPNFFERTAGAWLGEFVRDQGEFEKRDEL
jgi:hypothetical protein